MRRIRESLSIALLPALGPSGHPFGDGLTAGQWMAGTVLGDVDSGEAGDPSHAQHA
jgi:hypothetical protein